MRFAFLFASLLAVSPVSAQFDVGPPRPLTDAGEGFAHARFSPDGRFAAFTTPSYDGLWVRDLATGETWQVTDEPAAGYGATWSPDGGAILARVAREDASGRRNAVAVFDVEARTRTLLTDYRVRMPVLPAWQAGGAEVALPLGDGETFATTRSAVSGKATTPARVASGDALVDASTGRVVVQPVPGQAVLNAVASPSGEAYAFEVLGEGLFAVRADGTGLVFLGAGEHPTWSPDGAWIAFMRVEDDGHDLTGADLYAVRAQGGTPVRLTDTPDRLELFPHWTPAGDAIAFDSLSEGRIYLLPVTAR